MGWVVNATPPATLPLGKTRYLLCRGLGGPQGLSGWVRKISPPPEFDPRTVQPVANRCTVYPVPVYISRYNDEKFRPFIFCSL
jgi:hypothetical protein